MKIYLSGYDGGAAPAAVRVEESVSRALALAAGCRLVHNDLALWESRPARSIAKYRYQGSTAEAWEVAFATADRVVGALPGGPELPVERHVLRNELAAQLFRAAYDHVVLRTFRAGHPDVRVWRGPGRRVPLRAAALATLAFYRARLRGAAPGRVPVAPARRGPRTWLLFSGHAPSRAVAALLPELDPASLVALVNPGMMPKDVLQRLEALGVPCLPLAAPRPASWAVVRRDLDRLVAATGGDAEPFAPGDLGRVLGRLAVYWSGYASVPERSGAALEPGDVVVTGNDRTLSLATFVLEAARRAARTVTLQDGVFEGTLHVTTFPSDRIGVFGERFRRLYLDAGVAPSRVAVIGQRTWEDYAPEPAPDPARRLAAFGTDRRVALFCTQYFPVSDLEVRDALELVLRALATLPGWELVVKPHPHFPIDHVLARLSRPVRQVTGPVRPLVAAADAVLAVSSTVLIEATLLGRPAAAVTASGRVGTCPTADGVAVRELGSAAEVAAFLQHAPAVDVAAYRAANAVPFDGPRARALVCDP